MNDETVKIVAISQAVVRNRNLRGMVKDAMEAEELKITKTYDTKNPHCCANCGAETNRNHLCNGDWFCDNCYGFCDSIFEEFDTGLEGEEE